MTDFKEFTIARLFDLWFKENQGTFSEDTRRLYTFYYNQYISKAFDGRRVKDITASEWFEFESRLDSERNTSREYISAARFQQARTMFQRVFEFGAIRFGLPSPVYIENRGESNDELFSRNDVVKMIAAVQKFDIYHLCTMLGVLAGLTFSEMCGLQWKDIDLGHRLIRICRLGLAGNVPGRFIGTTEIVPLNSEREQRELPVPEWIMQQLEIMKASHDGEQLLLGEPFEEVKASRFRVHYTGFLKNAGVEYKTITVLRRTYAVHSLENGVAPEELSKLLGHTDVDETHRLFGKYIKKTRAEKLYDK